MSSQTPLSSRRRRHRTMAEAALDDLREAIILGELVPGAPLRLEEIANQLGMSISPIREAVRRLEALGLAEHVPHQGARVVGLDPDELRELFEVRLALETVAVRGAAARFTAEDAAAAQEHLDEWESARREDDTRAAMRRHNDFHFAIYGAARSKWLVRLIRPIWDSFERYRPALLSRDGDLQDRHQLLDEQLLAACAARDADAAADTMRRHLELAGEFYKVELGERGIYR